MLFNLVPPAFRYARQTAALRGTFSEYALIKERVVVEIEWLRVLAETEVCRFCYVGLSVAQRREPQTVGANTLLPCHTLIQAITEVPRLSPGAEAALDAIVASFDLHAATRVKEIESKTNHDVKAVEYFLKEAFDGEWCASMAGRPIAVRPLH